ncbi:unnamed protein product, partial [Trypanosoma congolense IL3000]
MGPFFSSFFFLKKKGSTWHAAALFSPSFLFLSLQLIILFGVFLLCGCVREKKISEGKQQQHNCVRRSVMQGEGKLVTQQLHRSDGEGIEKQLGYLMNLYRALCVRHDEIGQEIVLNDILALLTVNHQHDLAERVISTCEITHDHRSNNQAARYFYYVGLTRALLLDYVGANQCLQHALRK